MAATRKTRIKVGVIGLGIIGTRVAANLRSAGHQVYVWSRSPHSAPNFLGSVVEVADLCDMIQMFVSDDTALLEVVRTIAAALSPRHLIAAHATVSPAAARQAAAIIESQGARYLDAPFTGSKSAAQNRQLVYYVGGSKEALDEARPVLEATSRKILHLGGVGDASTLKIVTNMLTASTVQTLAEALAIVRASGIDGQKLVDAMEFNGTRSVTSDLKLPAMLAGNFEPHFSLKHMLKDARLALGLADAQGIPAPVAQTVTDILQETIEQDWGDLDFSVMARNYDAFLPPRPEPPVAPPPPESPAPPSEPVASLPAAPNAQGALLEPVGSTPKEDAVLAKDGKASGAGPAATESKPGSAGAAPVAPSDEAGAKTPEPAVRNSNGPAPILGDPNSGAPRKGTLRVIRDFFKPA